MCLLSTYFVPYIFLVTEVHISAFSDWGLVGARRSGGDTTESGRFADTQLVRGRRLWRANGSGGHYLWLVFLFPISFLLPVTSQTPSLPSDSTFSFQSLVLLFLKQWTNGQTSPISSTVFSQLYLCSHLYCKSKPHLLFLQQLSARGPDPPLNSSAHIILGSLCLV